MALTWLPANYTAVCFIDSAPGKQGTLLGGLPVVSLGNALEKELDVILFGHTHISKIEYGSTGILMMNPGSMSEPRLGKASFGVIVIEDGILTPRIVTVDDMERYFEYQTEDTGDTEN